MPQVIPTAKYSRVLQFTAGPQRHTFLACEEHKAELEKGEIDGLFVALKSKQVELLTAPDECDKCDFCREGGYD